MPGTSYFGQPYFAQEFSNADAGEPLAGMLGLFDWTGFPVGQGISVPAGAPAVGGRHMHAAAIIHQIYAEQQLAQIYEDRTNATLMFQRAMRQAEWNVTLEAVRKRQTEENMYTVLLTEL